MDRDQIIRELKSTITKQNSTINEQNNELTILREMHTHESGLEIKGKLEQNKF